MQVRKLFASPTADEQERKRARREDGREEKRKRENDEISNKARLLVALEE
jgi:hypothetical protein